MSKKPVKRVPLKFDGFEIGDADVYPDGLVIFKIHNSDVGEEIRNRLLSDTLDHVSINPRK